MASIVSGYEYDIFISYRQKDNKHDGWVTEFVNNLKGELESTFKEEVSVYFDINPDDGLLETNNVDASLKEKLKCLIFIPIISQTYCDVNSFAWQHEFCVFNKLAKEDKLGRDIKSSNGNITSRVLPVKIHELDEEDKKLLEEELGGVLRPVEFIFKSPGVNRPLTSRDNRSENLNKTIYRDQVNKVANAIKDIISSIKNPGALPARSTKPATRRLQKNFNTRIAIALALIIIVSTYLLYSKLSEKKPVEKSIAVLSFSDMSPARDQEYLGDGMAEEIINALSKIKGLKVIGRTSCFSFKGKNTDLKTIGKELGASTILEGSIQKSGYKIRITAQLINARDNSHIWSEQYDSELEDIFSVQDDITDKIVNKLEGTLFSKGESKARALTNDVGAYEMFLRARSLRIKGLEWQKTAIEYYQKAVQLDPSFAQAYAELSEVYWSSGYLGISNQNESFSKAEEAALKAISLDEDSYDGFNMLSFLNLTKDWDWESSLNNYNKAVSLGLPLPDRWHAYYQCWLYGCNDQIIKEAELMVEKDPLSVEALVHLSRIYFYSNRYDDVIKNAKKTLKISPDQTSILRQVGEAYFFMSKPDSALHYFQKLMVIDARYVPHDLIAAYIKLGNKEVAMEKFNEMKDSMDHVKQAICYLYFGEKEKVFASLEEAYREKDASMIGIKIDPHFKDIRSDPGIFADPEKDEIPGMNFNKIIMIQKLWFLNRIANWKSLLIFLAIYLLFNGYILRNSENKIIELAGKSVGIIDLTFGFNPQKTLMMVEEYGDEARAFYATTEMTTDVVYPIVYAFLFGIILTLLYRKSSNAWVNILPFICLVFDYLENINVVILLRTFPQQSIIVAILCEIFKLIKWITFGSVILLIIFGLVSVLISKLKKVRT